MIDSMLLQWGGLGRVGGPSVSAFADHGGDATGGSVDAGAAVVGGRVGGPSESAIAAASPAVGGRVSGPSESAGS